MTFSLGFCTSFAIFSRQSMANFCTVVLTRIDHTEINSNKKTIETTISKKCKTKRSNEKNPSSLPISRLFYEITLEPAIDFHTMPLETLQCRTNVNTSVGQVLVHFGSQHFLGWNNARDANVCHGKGSVLPV